ncbi:MAG: hypothetical protein ACK5KM_00960 [Hyphomicrobiaceae bacterium]
MQPAAALRAKRTTHWLASAWKPEGPGEFAPISSAFVLAVVLLWPATATSILNQIRLG